MNKYYLIHLLIYINIPILAQDASFTFSSNDFVNITSDASLQAETGMTIECWVNPESDTYTDYAPLVHYFRLGGPTEESGFTLQYFDSELRFMISVGSGNYDIVGDGLGLWPGTTLDQGIWTHIAGTYDVETASPVIIDQQAASPGSSIELKTGEHTIITTVETFLPVVLRLGPNLPKPKLTKPRKRLFMTRTYPAH